MIKIFVISMALAVQQVSCLPTNPAATMLVANQKGFHKVLAAPSHARNAGINLRGGGSTSNNQLKSKKGGLMDIHELTNAELREYIGDLVVEQLWAVLPVCIFLAGCQLIVLRHGINGAEGILFGLSLVVAGLTLFHFGLLYGLMPTGRAIGKKLPANLPLGKILAIACLLGTAVTMAEPALGIVKTAGSLVHENKAPYLYALLHRQQVSIHFLHTIAILQNQNGKTQLWALGEWSKAKLDLSRGPVRPPSSQPYMIMPQHWSKAVVTICPPQQQQPSARCPR